MKRRPLLVLLPLALVICAEAAPPEETVVNLDEMEWRPGPVDGMAIKQTLGDLVLMNVVRYEKGTIFPAHSHVNEQIALVRTGLYKVTVGGREHILEPGDVIVIPAYSEHEFEALEDSEHLEAFAPAVMNLRPSN